MSNLLNRLYASSGTEVLLKTLQISAGSENYWLVEGWDDLTLTLEDGSQQLFIGSGIDLALPAKNDDGTQDLQFAVGNITGAVSKAIGEAIGRRLVGVVTLRMYISTDFTAPAQRPYSLAIKSGYWKSTEVQITAGYMNILDMAWPRRRYNLIEHPGLRYIS